MFVEFLKPFNVGNNVLLVVVKHFMLNLYKNYLFQVTLFLIPQEREKGTIHLSVSKGDLKFQFGS